MQEITHYYTEAGQYDDEHKVSQKDYDSYNYVYIDVETNAETPQYPIFAFAFDPVQRKGWIAVDEQNTDVLQKMSRKEIKNTVKNQVKAEGESLNDIQYYPYISGEFLSDILTNVKGYNDEMEEQKKGICGHNAFFDLGMLSSEDEKLQENGTYEDVDGVMSAGKWSIGHKRAGSHGRLYEFKKNCKTDWHINVCDTMTVAKSIYKPASLDALTDYYNVNNIENKNGEHGILNKDYIKYNVNDVISTYKVQKNLKDEIRKIYKVNKPLHYIFSSASIAKNKMEQMGYDRTIYTSRSKKICSKAYFGGQTEALKTGKIINNVDYTDILSQYPTIAALTNVWEYMRAESVGIEEIENCELPDFDMDKLQSKEFWKEIHKYYVVVDAENCELPVRTDMNRNTTRVYKAKVDTDENIIYNYMDYIGAVINMDDSASIEIKQSFKIFKEGEQDLDDCEIGNTSIDADENLMQKIIEERKDIQINVNNGEKDEMTLAMKVIANSLYGVSAERLEQQSKEDGEVTERYDQAGKFYNPHVGTVLTAGGRLMLSIGESIAKENGGEMYYCDTDSLILDSSVTQKVQDYMNEMNPYTGVAGDLDVLEIEKENGYKLKNVSLFAMDVKKYCILKDDEIVMQKEHGLGHYENMRDKEDTKKFWEEIIKMNCKDIGEGMSETERNSIVKWQTTASTSLVRSQMSDLINQEVKYGDFIQRTIAKNSSEIVYLSTSLENDKLLKIDSENQTVSRVNSIEKENCKIVSDVLMDWISRERSKSDGRKRVTIAQTEMVNKEAKDIVDSYQNQIEETLNKVNLEKFI